MKKQLVVPRDLVFLVGLFLVAGSIGALIGFEPVLSAKLSLPVLLVLFLLVAANIPAQDKAPVRELRLALSALVVVSIFWPTYALFSFGGLPTLDPKKLLLAILLLVFAYGTVAAPAISGRIRQRLRSAGWPAKLLLVFMVWRLLSVLTSSTPGTAFIQYGWELVSFYLVFFAALACLDDANDVRKMMVVLMWAALAVGGLAVIERAIGHNLLTGLIPITPEYAAAQLAALSVQLREGVIRVQATFEHPMAMAEFLIFALPLAAAVAVGMYGKHSKRIPLAALMSLPLILIGIFYSGTRSAILASGGLMVLGVSLFFLRRARQGGMELKGYLSLLALIFVGLVVAASIGLASQLISGRSGGERGSNLERVEQIQRGLPKLQAAPLLGAGVGLGNDEIGFSSLRGKLYVDNYYLTLALDSGLPAAVVFLLAIGSFTWLGARLYFAGQGEASLLAGAIGLSVAGVAVMKLVLSIHYNLLFVYLAFAMLIVLKEQIEGKSDKTEA